MRTIETFSSLATYLVALPRKRSTLLIGIDAPGGIVLVEGCYALHQELAPFYDYTIWLECPRELRLARGIARGGEQIRDRWEHDWMVAEDRYIAAQHPRDRADLVIDSSGTLNHDMTHTYIRLVQ